MPDAPLPQTPTVPLADRVTTPSTPPIPPRPSFASELHLKRCDYAMDYTKYFLSLAAAGIAFVTTLEFAEHGLKIGAGWAVAILVLFTFSMLAGIAWLGIVITRTATDDFRIFGWVQIPALAQVLACGLAFLILSWQVIHLILSNTDSISAVVQGPTGDTAPQATPMPGQPGPP